MHELGICESIVGAVERRAAGRPVARVRVRMGTLHLVHPGAFEQSFAIAAAGTVADGADADLVFVPVEGRCRSCGIAFRTEEPSPACPSCGSIDIDASGGDEMVLESIEYRPTPAG